MKFVLLWLRGYVALRGYNPKKKVHSTPYIAVQLSTVQCSTSVPPFLVMQKSELTPEWVVTYCIYLALLYFTVLYCTVMYILYCNVLHCTFNCTSL